MGWKGVEQYITSYSFLHTFVMLRAFVMVLSFVKKSIFGWSPVAPRPQRDRRYRHKPPVYVYYVFKCGEYNVGISTQLMCIFHRNFMPG